MSTAVPAWLGLARHGLSRHGVAVKACHVRSSQVESVHGVAGVAARGIAWLGPARRDLAVVALPGSAGLRTDWQVEAGSDGLGSSGRGGAELGMAWLSRLGQVRHVRARRGLARQAGYGTVGLGPSRLRWAWCGRRVGAGSVWVRLGVVGRGRQGQARHGQAGRVVAGLGWAGAA